jgi:hypothetical protein
LKAELQNPAGEAGACTFGPDDRRSALRMRLHRIRWPAQVRHELPELKIPSRWDRDNLCVDPFGRRWSLNVKFHFLHKEKTFTRSQVQIQRFRSSEICSYSADYEGLLVDSNPPDSDADAQVSWDTPYLFHLQKRYFFEEARRIRNNLWFISTIAQFTQVGLQQIGSKNMACAACHTHLICLIWHPMTFICFIEWNKSPNGFRWLMRSRLLSPWKSL